MTKIMIVDDEEDLREMLDLYLKKEGFETNTAEDGADFLRKIDDFQPDLVTLDVMMPGLKTTDILEKLKEKKGKPKIILLTVVRYTDSEKQKLYQMGNIVDYVTKPFDLDDLLERIHKQVLSLEKLNGASN
ncbi:MAG: response regulator [Euryarchaeota archaeon]|nr:response regulator [Euryarchaeota archaeon]